MPLMFLLSAIALATSSTGITHCAPLCNADAMVDHRNTSMITTTALRRSYKCSNAGETGIGVGLLFAMRPQNKKER
jgi:hypothetical protein